jgi:hypothetical protein
MQHFFLHILTTEVTETTTVVIRTGAARVKHRRVSKKRQPKQRKQANETRVVTPDWRSPLRAADSVFMRSNDD